MWCRGSPPGIYLRAEGIRERTLNMALTRATEWTTWPLPYGPLVLPATTGDVILIHHQALIIPGSGGNGASRLCYRFAGQGTTPLITSICDQFTSTQTEYRHTFDRVEVTEPYGSVEIWGEYYSTGYSGQIINGTKVYAQGVDIQGGHSRSDTG